ncbi:MAG: DnaJ domain-containing protein [Gammaproteobacteria bacterium]|nr:DnaJ domain-containing protein [Gammaproteobacteria bacterium]
MDNRRNYYRILHVQPDAPLEIIKSSYRTLMQKLKHHPDLGGDHWNAALINEAYRVLTNTELRESYDRERELELYQRAQEQAAAAAHEEKEQSEQPERQYSEPAKDLKTVCLFCGQAHGRHNINDQNIVCPHCDSPLHSIDERSADQSGQRTIERMPRTFDIRYFVTWPQAKPDIGQTEDLSPGGLRFRATRHIAEGTRIKINSELLSAIGLVTYCCRTDKGNGWHVGIAFETLRFKQTQGTFFSAKA